MKLQDNSLENSCIRSVNMLQNIEIFWEEEVRLSESVAAQGRAQFCVAPLAGQL